MAYKLNMAGFRADDWVADNYDPVFNTDAGRDNPGGYDAVNIYGDEGNRLFNFATNRRFPGLGRIYRQGYQEIDLVDYDSENLKVGAAVHFRLNPERSLESTELLVASNYSTGTTVYQGDNRFSLRNIQFFQHRLELRNRDNFFVRAYVTHEDAGDSYDPYFTAIRLQDRHKDDDTWRTDYSTYWQNTVFPELRNNENFSTCFPRECGIGEQDQQRAAFFASAEGMALLERYHAEARAYAQSSTAVGTEDFYEVGTQRFTDAFNEIVSTPVTEGGTQFFDRSALYHLHGEKQLPGIWEPNENTRLDLTFGGNGRIYTPNSNGTILLDTAGRNIDTWEVGAYGGGTLNLNNRFKISASLRADRHENFSLNLSPAASLVYTPTDITTARISFSSALRNPTLNDQFLNYNVGRAILLGNIDGVEDLLTVESVIDFSNTGNQDTLDFFDVAPIRPERVRTLEAGLRTTLWEKLYLDATYYYSFYTDFIGFNIGVDLSYFGANITSTPQAYRVSANARDQVTTQGFSVGGNYYFGDYFTLNGNYSFNRLNTTTDDPIIPAFNTPEHKYNIGVAGRDVPLSYIFGNGIPSFGFNVTYKWVDGFLFEGSPQFTGLIEAYGLLDAQVNFGIPRINTTIKLGASNLLDNDVFQVYGGPRIGRLAYVSATYSLDRR